jgi:RNA polymerase sigma-70 factor (ECF subfamily)
MTVLSIGENRRSPAGAGRAGAARRNESVRVPPDGRIAMAAGEDDKAAFARIVLPHLTDAYSLARWITGNRADAEDVVQEASLRAFRAIRNVDANPRAWLLTIVRNTAFTWLRKNRPAALVVVEELEELADAQSAAGVIDADTPETAFIAKAESAQLEAAIAGLPTVFREVLVLRDIHGLSYREIAEVTGMPIGTVMSRLARGRGRLIDLLARRAS